MDPNQKCPHGVYLAGEKKARYCQSCTPSVNDCTLRANPTFKPGKGAIPNEPVLHVDEFLNQPMGFRLKEMAAHFDTTT